MKKGFVWVLVLCLMTGALAFAEGDKPATSYESMELTMPAAGLRVFVPANMDSIGGDEEAYDLGYRFNCSSDTFDLSVWVHDSRDMDLADYAAFFAERSGMTAAPDHVNGFAVQLLTDAAKPGEYTILLAAPDQEAPPAIYELSFSCAGEADIKLAEEIMGTLSVME